MEEEQNKQFLQLAEEAARMAGGLIKANFGRHLAVDVTEAHDIKIELDRRTQRLIEGHILEKHPEHAIYGEEGISGNQEGEYQWIIDPIDGTVNFFYGIPHFAISIALRRKGATQVGVIYDPMKEEMWTACRGGKAYLNAHPVQVSTRSRLSEAVLSVGFAKTSESVESGLSLFKRMAREAKKCRMLGSAALDMAYVACGRLDAYIESQISLWDIAAGHLLIECAGGRVELKPHATIADKYSIVAETGNMDLGL
ncbi:MAG: inositol monophosphatase family protein [Chthoniobacterales bacterium]